MQPELSLPPDLETRLVEAADRARATRAVGGTLSPRAARDLRVRLLGQGSGGAPDVAAAPDAPAAATDVEQPPAPESGTRQPGVRVERRRWARESTREPAVTAAVTAPVVPAPARPRTGRTRRWAALGRLAVLVIIGAVLIGAATYASGRLAAPTALTASVVNATGAMATRVGAPIQLAAGTVLQVGDTVTVSSQGQAVLALGASRVRLAGGSAVHLERLDGAGIGVSQLAGRVYYRVAPADQAPFHVSTGPVTWTAAGTAFDTDREPVPAGQGSGQERVTLLALQDAVTATGPGFETAVPQGDRATIYIGSSTPTVAPALDGVPAQALLDPWLQANGLLDQAAGWPLGILDGHLQVAVVSPSPTPAPFVTPSVSPTDTPFPTGLETPSPSPSPTSARTPAPTPVVTPGPTPSPTPGIGALSLFATSCPGGVVLDWSKYSGKGIFSRYVTLRSPASDPAPPAAYPPSAGYIAEIDGTTSRAALSGYDPYGQATQFRYRTLALDATGKVLAASAARGPAGGAGAVASMTLSVTPNISFPMETDFAWSTFSGPAACFSQYEVRYAATPGLAPTGTIAATSAGMGTSGIDKVAVAAGAHYFVVIVRRFTAVGGSLMVAESAPVFYTVP